MAAIKLKFGFIPFPLAIVDDAADLSLGEYRLLGYLLRHQFRVKTDVVKLKQDELLHGVWRPNGKTRWDGGSGITSPRDLKAARVALEARGWLKVELTMDGMFFELCLAPDEEEDEADSGADSGSEEAAELGADLGIAPSAKCTQENAPARVQNAPGGECILSTFRVQNALVDIRKEKVQEGSTRKNPPTPQGGIADLILKPIREDEGNGEGQRLPGESKGKGKKELRVVALRAGVDAELEDLQERVRPRNDAVAKVLRECGLADPRGRGVTKVVGAAMDTHFERSPEAGKAEPRNWNALAEQMTAAYKGFLKVKHLMALHVGPRGFFADGMWNDDRKWPWDQKLRKESEKRQIGKPREPEVEMPLAEVNALRARMGLNRLQA